MKTEHLWAVALLLFLLTSFTLENVSVITGVLALLGLAAVIGALALEQKGARR